MKARPVAIMHMMDCGESDDKIIAVPVDDKRWDDIKDLNDLNKHSLREFKLFFEMNKKLKGEDPDKYVIEVTGIEGKDKAIEAIVKSQELYKEKFSK